MDTKNLWIWKNAELTEQFNQKVEHDEKAFQKLDAESREIAKNLEEQRMEVEKIKKEGEANNEMLKLKEKEIELYEKNLTLLKHEFGKIKQR